MTTPKKDYFSKKGTGVYRRWTHLIPMRGAGAVQRRRVRGAKSEITLKDDIKTKFPIRSIRRAASQGFPGILYASKRPCCRKECQACMPNDKHFHDFGECETTAYTTCQEIRLEPNSIQPPTPSDRGALAQEGAALGTVARAGDFMAIETESDETPWWLVRVVKPAASVPTKYKCPNLHCDVAFDYPRNKQGLMVERLRPAVTSRGADSTTLFEVDMTLKAFIVPCHLLRVGKIKLIERPGPRRTQPRRGSAPATAAAAAQFELKAEIKAQIYERCRCWGDS